MNEKQNKKIYMEETILRLWRIKYVVQLEDICA